MKKGFFPTLEDFLRSLSHKILWGAAFSAFLFCVAFAVNFFLSFPHEWININNRRADIEKRLVSYDAVDAMIGYLIDGLSATREAEEIYTEFRKEVQDQQAIPEHQVLVEYYIKIQEKNNQVTRVIGQLDSTRSNVPVFDDYAKEFSDDLKQYQVNFDEMQNVLKSLIDNNDTRTTLEHILVQAKTMIQMPIYLEKTLIRYSGFQQEVDDYFRQIESDQKLLWSDTDVFFKKMRFAEGCVVWVLGFVIFTGWKWYRFTHVKHKRPAQLNKPPKQPKRRR